MDALFGPYDVAIIARFPANQDAMRASLALGKATGICFATLPAVPGSAFDKPAAQI